MVVVVLYKWQVKPEFEDQFITSWSDGTKLIHEKCGSYGARLHKATDDTYYSYAVWPDEQSRTKCFDTDITDHSSFRKMQEAVVEYLGETVLTPVSDLLDEIPSAKKHKAD